MPQPISPTTEIPNEAKATPAYSVLFVGGLALLCWVLLIWMLLEAWSSP